MAVRSSLPADRPQRHCGGVADERVRIEQRRDQGRRGGLDGGADPAQRLGRLAADGGTPVNPQQSASDGTAAFALAPMSPIARAAAMRAGSKSSFSAFGAASPDCC
jgi:hypothetical protein